MCVVYKCVPGSRVAGGTPQGDVGWPRAMLTDLCVWRIASPRTRGAG